MQRRIICENLRSAYNVGNILRTADGLGRWVILAGYTAWPDHSWVKKTALWAEQTVNLQVYDDLTQCYDACQSQGVLLALELTSSSRDLDKIDPTLKSQLSNHGNLYVVLGNEVTGVESSTLARADYHIQIPMRWLKESLNVGQAAAIAMWELNKV